MVEFMTARFNYYNQKYPGVPIDLIMLYVLKGVEAAGMRFTKVENFGSHYEIRSVAEWEPEVHKVMPSPLTETELKDVIENDEDLRTEGQDGSDSEKDKR